MPERRLAAITGASSGIGAAFARKLAARGYDLLLIARREDRLNELARELMAAHPISVDVMAADLSQADPLEAVARRIEESATLVLLVNNAGFGLMGFFYEVPVDRLMEMHRLNVLATMRLSHAALKNFTRRGGASDGGIINVSSVAAFATAPSSVVYNATKAWMKQFTEGLALEMAAKNLPVRVQALCPGFTLTEFHDVVRMDRGAIPKSMWMTSEFVVDESLKGFDQGKLIVIPGWRYRLLVFFIRRMPPTWMRRISIASARRFRKPKA